MRLKPWFSFYRPAQDWRSSVADAVEVRGGLSLIHPYDGPAVAPAGMAGVPEGAALSGKVGGFQFGLVWGVRCGFGLCVWLNQAEGPLFSVNWFVRAPAVA